MPHFLTFDRSITVSNKDRLLSKILTGRWQSVNYWTASSRVLPLRQVDIKLASLWYWWWALSGAERWRWRRRRQRWTQVMLLRLQQKTTPSVEWVWHNAVHLSYRFRTTAAADGIVGVVKWRRYVTRPCVLPAADKSHCKEQAIGWIATSAVKQREGDNSCA